MEICHVLMRNLATGLVVNILLINQDCTKIFPRALSPAFFSQLKTALFSRAGVGGASE